MKLSKLITRLIKSPSPIREIMKMADPVNIKAMGLNPEDVISFAGGWVAHNPPPELKEIYLEIIEDPELWYRTGGYSATPGDTDVRASLARLEEELSGVKNISYKNVIVGQSSTQLIYSLFQTLLDPEDSILFLDPTYPNYFTQYFFSIGFIKESGILRVPFLDPIEWSLRLEGAKQKILDLLGSGAVKIFVLPSPDNPTSQVFPDSFLREVLEEALNHDIWVIIDYAYKYLNFGVSPDYYSYSPTDYPNLIALHSNSKWMRNLGRRMGWVIANEKVIEGLERAQQAHILCPDSLHQAAISKFIDKTLDNGTLKRFISETKVRYRELAELTVKSLEKHLHFPYIEPMGGIYLVCKVGMDSDLFVRKVFRSTGVLFVPGKGFGSTLSEGIRISYGPLINTPEKVEEGFERVERFIEEEGLSEKQD